MASLSPSRCVGIYFSYVRGRKPEVSKHLVLDGTESWPLHDNTDLDQLRADLRAAMEDGKVTEAHVVPDGEGSDTLLINRTYAVRVRRRG